MDELLREMRLFPDETQAPTLLVVLVATALSFVLSLLVVRTYRSTHSGPSYSQATAHTLVIMAVETSVIMPINGSNIARAFSLAGALSVIRFRSAVKDPRDVAFLYFAMAIGMAAGTRFFAIAAALALLGCGMIHLLSLFRVGALPFDRYLLKLLVRADTDLRDTLESVLERELTDYTLLSVAAAAADEMEVSYSVRLGRGGEARLLSALREQEGVHSVLLLPARNDDAVA
ncbi:MAG: DUF4956 domain-containing protein [Planctomycetota bacterium]|nr:MAG: DUF4956 domain-containing protein [Planctomycetota bacterium]